MPWTRRRFGLAAVRLLGVMVLGCSTERPEPTPTPALTATSTPFATVTSTPVPTSTPAPTATPAGAIQFLPPQVEQGDVAVVYLNLEATSATVRFQDRQYPMLNDGRWWAMIGASPLVSPGLQPLSIAYFPPARTDAVTVAQSLTVRDREFPVESITLDPGGAALLAPDIVQGELAQRASIYSGYTTQRLWRGAFVRPNNSIISSPFGVFRSYNGGPATDYHRGTDFAGFIGDPVVAAAAGRVVFTGALQIRGNAIMVDHGAGVFTAYHHLSAINVSQGQNVTTGQLIGAVGSTGLVAGPHLHWEVIIRGVEVDGEHWLQGKEIGP